ncbi:MAG TPA: DUF1851 domain-containing protein [Povalibacter sp.]|nr:DUF1851 domain-containing protein [Povalibacter sp.]
MNIHDYLIAPSGINWTRLLQDWTPPLPSGVTVWLVNRFGDVVVVSPQGTVHRLDVTAGTYTEIARSREHFAQLLDVAGNAEAWLRVALVDACRKAGTNLSPGQCYGFKVPPTLGGKYEVANIVPTALDTHYSFQAYVCKQTDIYWIPGG